MILNTGSRTDIPAYFSDWFYNRIQEGFVMVRNPYYPQLVTKYSLSPDVIDAMVFCTKNPEPMFSKFHLLSPYSMFWFVTITPYAKDIEPFVPDKKQVLESFKTLSELVGRERISWRYDPVLITQKYTVEYHIRMFARMASILKGYTTQCVVSFLDLYEKTKKNFPEAREVSYEEQKKLISAFSLAAYENNMTIHLCCEDERLTCANVDADGCLSQNVLEKAIGQRLIVPKKKSARTSCQCLLGADIGAYNTCGHGCLYCYANYDRRLVLDNMRNHDKNSPFLIGHAREGDVVKEAVQRSWADRQMNIFDFF